MIISEYFKRWSGHGIKFYQGIIKKCRLSIEIPNYQAILEANRMLDTLKHNFPSFNRTCYITLRVHIINSQSTVPPLCSSLSSTIDFNALSKSTHLDNQKMNPIQVHNHIWSPHKPPCHCNHHRLHIKTLQDIYF